MVQVLEENRRPSFSQRLGRSVGVGLEGAQNLYNKYQEAEKFNKTKQAIAEITKNQSWLNINDPKMLARGLELYQQGENQKAIESLKGTRGKEDAKRKQEVGALSGAIDTVNRMRELRSKGNLGIGSSIWNIWNPESRQQAGEYEQLGKSLIQHATNIPIRNRLEFETLAEELYDPTISDARAEGVLNAMERIINNSLSQYEGEEEEERPGRVPKKAARPTEKRPLTSFEK